MIKLTFAGAAGGVTGSRHLIECGSEKILLDCGLFQGRRKDTYERNLNFPFDPSSVDVLVISHAHIDHIGNVPNLVKQGFKGDIHCTLATADLMNIMLLDSAHIQESDIGYVNKVRSRHHQPPVEPLYIREDIPPVADLIEGHAYNRYFKLNSARALFRNAGHIIGSAITIVELDDRGRKLSVCFTGDLGRPRLPIIRDPYQVTEADVLIIESTYGDRLHSDIERVEGKLAEVVNQTIARQGKVVIPSFALERTQELIYTLHQLILRKWIPSGIPVYVDSPLAIDATEIFRMHPECFDRETNEMLRTVDDPFGFHHLHYTRKTEESKAINNVEGPAIIIAGSGMAESGRVLHHLKNYIQNPLNTVLIVGWQAENTLGRKIQEKWPKVSIFGESYELNAQVEVFDEFSAHADRNDLLAWIKGGKWRRIFLVHGEPESCASLAAALKEEGISRVEVPKLGDSFEV
ncbi:MAG: MBL fold metallo-hydrolase [Dehalococcoidales bacterium]|nr:MBL fold metallo-hydrolase [Dehalococcoidales bacterium]